MSRLYQPIWEEIVRRHIAVKKPVQIRCAAMDKKKLVKAVVKEKNIDIVRKHKYLLEVITEVESLDSNMVIITFSLKPRLCVQNL